jgi:hypothetical protein
LISIGLSGAGSPTAASPHHTLGRPWRRCGA